MADTGVQTITGEGEYLLDAGHLITGLLWWIDTDSIEVDYRSTVRPRRVMHAGWIALASGTTGVAGSLLPLSDFETDWFSYFDFEANVRVNPSPNVNIDRIIWSLAGGVTAKFQAFW